ESRKALVGRIRRLAAGPLPKSARLGLWGFATVALIGLALLPMAGSRRAVADKPANEVRTNTLAETPEEKPALSAARSGRVTDEKGKPVSDAQIQLVHVATAIVQETKTDQNGNYVVDRAWNSGEHRLKIFSQRCVGLADHHNCPRVVLEAH